MFLTSKKNPPVKQTQRAGFKFFVAHRKQVNCELLLCDALEILWLVKLSTPIYHLKFGFRDLWRDYPNLIQFAQNLSDAIAQSRIYNTLQ